MYNLAFIWVMLVIAIMIVCATGIRLAWELSKIGLIIGLGGAVLVIMGVI